MQLCRHDTNKSGYLSTTDFREVMRRNGAHPTQIDQFISQFGYQRVFPSSTILSPSPPSVEPPESHRRRTRHANGVGCAHLWSAGEVRAATPIPERDIADPHDAPHEGYTAVYLVDYVKCVEHFFAVALPASTHANCFFHSPTAVNREHNSKSETDGRESERESQTMDASSVFRDGDAPPAVACSLPCASPSTPASTARVPSRKTYQLALRYAAAHPPCVSLASSLTPHTSMCMVDPVFPTSMDKGKATKDERPDRESERRERKRRSSPHGSAKGDDKSGILHQQHPTRDEQKGDGDREKTMEKERARTRSESVQHAEHEEHRPSLSLYSSSSSPLTSLFPYRIPKDDGHRGPFICQGVTWHGQEDPSRPYPPDFSSVSSSSSDGDTTGAMDASGEKQLPFPTAMATMIRTAATHHSPTAARRAKAYGAASIPFFVGGDHAAESDKVHKGEPDDRPAAAASPHSSCTGSTPPPRCRPSSSSTTSILGTSSPSLPRHASSSVSSLFSAAAPPPCRAEEEEEERASHTSVSLGRTLPPPSERPQDGRDQEDDEGDGDHDCGTAVDPNTRLPIRASCTGRHPHEGRSCGGGRERRRSGGGDRTRTRSRAAAARPLCLPFHAAGPLPSPVPTHTAADTPPCPAAVSWLAGHPQGKGEGDAPSSCRLLSVEACRDVVSRVWPSMVPPLGSPHLGDGKQRTPTPNTEAIRVVPPPTSPPPPPPPPPRGTRSATTRWPTAVEDDGSGSAGDAAHARVEQDENPSGERMSPMTPEETIPPTPSCPISIADDRFLSRHGSITKARWPWAVAASSTRSAQDTPLLLHERKTRERVGRWTREQACLTMTPPIGHQGHPKTALSSSSSSSSTSSFSSFHSPKGRTGHPPSSASFLPPAVAAPTSYASQWEQKVVVHVFPPPPRAAVTHSTTPSPLPRNASSRLDRPVRLVCSSSVVSSRASTTTRTGWTTRRVTRSSTLHGPPLTRHPTVAGKHFTRQRPSSAWTGTTRPSSFSTSPSPSLTVAGLPPPAPPLIGSVDGLPVSTCPPSSASSSLHVRDAPPLLGRDQRKEEVPPVHESAIHVAAPSSCPSERRAASSAEERGRVGIGWSSSAAAASPPPRPSLDGVAFSEALVTRKHDTKEEEEEEEGSDGSTTTTSLSSSPGIPLDSSPTPETFLPPALFSRSSSSPVVVAAPEVYHSASISPSPRSTTDACATVKRKSGPSPSKKEEEKGSSAREAPPHAISCPAFPSPSPHARSVGWDHRRACGAALLTACVLRHPAAIQTLSLYEVQRAWMDVFSDVSQTEDREASWPFLPWCRQTSSTPPPAHPPPLLLPPRPVAPSPSPGPPPLRWFSPSRAAECGVSVVAWLQALPQEQKPTLSSSSSSLSALTEEERRRGSIRTEPLLEALAEGVKTPPLPSAHGLDFKWQNDLDVAHTERKAEDMHDFHTRILLS